MDNEYTNTGSYRLGRAMADKSWPRPAENIYTDYRNRGHRLPRHAASFAAAEEQHRLMLLGWDDARKETRA